MKKKRIKLLFDFGSAARKNETQTRTNVKKTLFLFFSLFRGRGERLKSCIHYCGVHSQYEDNYCFHHYKGD